LPRLVWSCYYRQHTIASRYAYRILERSPNVWSKRISMTRISSFGYYDYYYYYYCIYIQSSKISRRAATLGVRSARARCGRIDLNIGAISRYTVVYRSSRLSSRDWSFFQCTPSARYVCATFLAWNQPRQLTSNDVNSANAKMSLKRGEPLEREDSRSLRDRNSRPGWQFRKIGGEKSSRSPSAFVGIGIVERRESYVISCLHTNSIRSRSPVRSNESMSCR